MLTESQYKIQAEKLNAQIRQQKIYGLQADLEKEKHLTQAKEVRRDIAREQLQTEKINLQIAQEKTTHARLKLIGSRIDTQLIELENGCKTDQLSFESQSREIGRQMIAARLTSLRLNVAETEQLNADRRSEYRLRGIATPANALPPPITR